MKERFTAICAITFFDPDANTAKEYIVLTNVGSFQEAMEQIEEYYGNDLAAVNITLAPDRFYNITKEQYNTIIDATI
jgi:hypothetical protein